MAKKTLGKGLGALFEKIEDTKNEAVLEVSMSKIIPNPDQVRHDFDEENIKELAASIDNHGLLEPILITKNEDNEDKYLIVAGERRYRAFLQLERTSIPAIIKEFKKDEIKKLSLIENIQRENLNPIEEAISYKELMDELNMTQTEFSKEIGKSRSHVANSVRLLKLEKEVLDKVRSGEISFGHAKILSGLNKDEQIKLARKILSLGLSVRETENEVSPKKKKSKESYYTELEKDISDKLMTKVKIKDKKGKGQILISYFSEDELTRIIDIFESL